MKSAICYIIVSFKHIGDYNQALFIKKTYEKQESKLFDLVLIDAEQDIIEKFEHNVNCCLHSIGEKGLQLLMNLKKKNEKFDDLTLIVQIHQHFSTIWDLKPHYLIIPQTNFKDHSNLSKTHKILLKGTPFEKFTDQELKKMYLTSHISQKINLSQNYIIVMLSGDAPDQKSMKFFTKQSAETLLFRLVYILGSLQKKYQIIVQNGPRTGKYDPQTGQQKCLHTFKSGYNQNQAVDLVSLYFINRLKQLNIPYIFFNFSFQMTETGRKINSVYKPLLYLAQQNENYFLFPMESVSMCSQLPYYIPSTRLICYETSSTNELHMKGADFGYQKGQYKIFIGPGLGQLKWNQMKDNNKFDEIQDVISSLTEKINDRLSSEQQK